MAIITRVYTCVHSSTKFKFMYPDTKFSTFLICTAVSRVLPAATKFSPVTIRLVLEYL
jgi:hypothetical protein